MTHKWKENSFIFSVVPSCKELFLTTRVSNLSIMFDCMYTLQQSCGYTLHNSTSLSGASAPVWHYLSRRWLVTHWAACLNSYAYIVRSRSKPQLTLAAIHLILLINTKLLLFLHFFLANSNFYHKFLHFLANSDIKDSKSSYFLANSLTRNALLWNLAVGPSIAPLDSK